MQCLNRNKRPLYYALFTGKSAIDDSNGHKTGEYALTYSDPVLTRMNYSAGSNSLEVGEYGIEEKYDRIMVTDDMNCPIAEDSRIWIDVVPSAPHNYVVSKRQDGLDSIKYGLTKVKVS